MLYQFLKSFAIYELLIFVSLEYHEHENTTVYKIWTAWPIFIKFYTQYR